MRSSLVAAVISSGAALVLTTSAYAGNSPAQLTIRGGYAKYYAFNFGTVGAEASIRTVAGLHAIVGLEAYAVEIILPPEEQLGDDGKFSEWNTLLPINAGAVYKIDVGKFVRPYGGADIIFGQYYRGEDASDWTVGARARLGVDVMPIPNIGLNANLAVGGWSGKRWNDLQAGLPNSGWLPQISAGVVLAL